MRDFISSLILLSAAAAAAAAPVSVRVADESGRPVAGAVIFAYALPQPERPAPPAAPYVMDQKAMRFVPELLVITRGASVRFPNSDKVQHHLYSFSAARSFEIPLYRGDAVPPMRFDSPGVVEIGCNIHDWMRGVVLVLPNERWAQTSEDGTATLELPGDGSGVELAAYHPRSREPVDATRRVLEPDPGPQTWTLRLRAVRPRRLP